MVDSFIFFQSYYEAICALDAESQLSLFHAMCEYVYRDKEPSLEGPAFGMWALIKPLLDSSVSKRQARQAAGHKGGKQNASKREANEKQTESKPEGNSNCNSNSNCNVKDIEGKPKRFSPPTVDDVKAYCSERNNSVDAERFVDFYSSKGWKVGNQAMKDWKACVRTWEKRDTEKKQKMSPFIQGTLEDDLDEIERLTRRKVT